MRKGLLAGALAGAAGTTALNAITYADMALRGRPASGMPERTVDEITDRTGVRLGEGESASNRRQGLAALLGFGTGVGVGALYGLISSRGTGASAPAAIGLAVAASMTSAVPAAALGLTDPLGWDAADWLSDMVPHLAYGAVTTATFKKIADGL
jgi:hypothetical protein